MYETDKPDPVYGWSFARLSDETKKIISKMEIDQSIFTISRKGREQFQRIQEISDTINSIEAALIDSNNNDTAATTPATQEKKKKNLITDGPVLVVISL
ncbi:hypothetical protein [Bacillus cereus]|uniref:hypothetical protein n=1 Tax=Bacillus cereus TaxID=1396 RepID=UPI0037F2003F